MAKHRTQRTAEKEGEFFAALASGASVTKAAALLGQHRQRVYERRKADPEFAARMDEAVEEGTDSLEDEMVRRAFTGVAKPVFQRGKLVGHIQEFSDTLLIFALKARRREKFSDRIEHTGAGGGPVQTEDVSTTQLARAIAFALTQAQPEPQS